jgi:hypothetical protein
MTKDERQKIMEEALRKMPEYTRPNAQLPFWLSATVLAGGIIGILVLAVMGSIRASN